MTRKLAVRLDAPAHEMAQEEIHKQVAYLARGITGVRFAEGGLHLELEAPEDAPPDLGDRVLALARHVQRSLRSLRRKVVYRSPALDRPGFRGSGAPAGVHVLANGQVALEGLPLRLFRYFDRLFGAFGEAWDAEPLLTPTLIPTRALARCDYLRSFPHNVTFACHLPEQAERIDAFRARHQDRDDLDGQALADMQAPEACLSPAVCYHVYHLNEGRTVPDTGLAYAVGGKCFRYESNNMRDLRRLWDFTMREVVFLGTQADVLARRERGIALVARLLEEHELAGEIRSASDPFFNAPENLAKTFFQLSTETKYEVSLPLEDGARLAVGSLNYHSDFFGRAFRVAVEGAGPMHSVCVGFGLERWVCAFLAQHGEDVSAWPAVVRDAPELAGRSAPRGAGRAA
jgi:seryl-tRNA synthetase